jgi:competence protein ComEA
MNHFIHAARSLSLGLLLAAGLVAVGTPVAHAGEHVDINTASAAEIDAALVNVGRTKAEAIVAYRKAHGRFESAEQLALVKGIGLSTVEKNRDRISLGSAPVRTKASKSDRSGSK